MATPRLREVAWVGVGFWVWGIAARSGVARQVGVCTSSASRLGRVVVVVESARWVAVGVGVEVGMFVGSGWAEMLGIRWPGACGLWRACGAGW